MRWSVTCYLSHAKGAVADEVPKARLIVGRSADHCFLRNGCHKSSAAVVKSAKGQAAPALRRRSFQRIEQPLVDAKWAVKPHGMIEARCAKSWRRPWDAVLTHDRLDQQVVARKRQRCRVNELIPFERVTASQPH